MADWRYRDTLGILIVLGSTLAAARTLDGLASALVDLVGAVVALLWIAKFFLEGYAEAVDPAARKE